MSTTGETVAEILSAYHDIGAETVRSEPGAQVIQVNPSTIFRGVNQPLYLIVVEPAQLEECLAKQTIWLDKLISECLLDSPIVPIILGPKGNVANAVRLIKNSKEGAEQPVLPLEEVQKVSDAKEALRDAVIRSASSRRVNPYRIHKLAIRGMFFGRSREIHRLQSGQGHQFIVGARRIGKSSLVNQLKEEITNSSKHYTLRLGSFVIGKKASYVDVSTLGERTPELIWGKILAGFGVDQRRLDLYSRKYSRGGKRPSIVQDEAFSLETLIERSRGALTIILDEMDGWIDREAKVKWKTIDRLRSITDGGQAKLILVGYELLKVALLNDKFPLVARGESLTLGPIDFDSVKQLVLLPLSEFRIRLNPEGEILQRIWRATSGMPHVVHDICRHVLEFCLERKRDFVSLSDLRDAMNRSGTLRDFRQGVINSDFSLAEAIAGIVACSSKAKDKDKDKDKDNVTNGEILSQLRAAGYEYDEEEFELALNYLDLRLSIRPLDDSRSRWTSFNSSQRDHMANYINSGAGLDSWLSHQIRKHKLGSWKSRYEGLI